jgi:hypothetical protein
MVAASLRSAMVTASLGAVRVTLGGAVRVTGSLGCI